MCIRDRYATGFGCYKFYKEGVNSLKDKYLQWSSKFGKASLIKICPFEEIDTIITDGGITPLMEEKIRKTGTRLIIS